MLRRLYLFGYYLIACIQVFTSTLMAAWLVEPDLAWWPRMTEQPFDVLFAVMIGGYLTYGLRNILGCYNLPEDTYR